jgi:hypothetical protein
MFTKFLIRHSIIVLILVFIISFSACSKSAPGCADKETVDLVIQITKDKIVENFGQQVADSLELRLDNIRTQNKDNKTGMCLCAAEITSVGPNGSNNIPITYKSELIDGNDEKFYVTVFGL